MTNINHRQRYAVVSRIVKRVPFYFAIAAACIGAVAVVQFLALKHMPMWAATEASKPNDRLIDFAVSQGGNLLVAEYINCAERIDMPVRLTVTLMDPAKSASRSLVCDPDVLKGAVSPCGNWLATSHADGTVSLQSLQDFNDRSQLKVQLEKCRKELYWSHNSEMLLIRSESLLSLVNWRADKLVANLPIDSSGHLSAPEGASCFLACSNGRYYLFDWHTGSPLQQVHINPEARLVALSPDLRFAASLVGSTISLFDLQEERELWSRQYRVPWSIKNAICFSPDNRYLAVVNLPGQSFDCAINILDTETLNEACCRLPDGERFVGLKLAEEDSLWLWDTTGAISKWHFQPLNPSQMESLLIRRQQLMPEFE